MCEKMLEIIIRELILKSNCKETMIYSRNSQGIIVFSKKISKKVNMQNKERLIIEFELISQISRLRR